MNVQIDISNCILHTPRLVLRPWRKEDLNDLYEYASVDGVGQMAGWEPHRSLETSRRVLDMFMQEKKTFAVEYNGKAIGSLGIEKYDEKKFPELAERRCREIGYVLAKDYWGQGLMPEAVSEVIRYLFEDLKLDAIMCGHFLSNAQSARVQEKCGFRHYVYAEYTTLTGERKQEEVNILTREDWLGAAGEFGATEKVGAAADCGKATSGRTAGDTFPALDRTKVEEELAYWNIPGVTIGVTDRSHTLWLEGFGKRNLATGEPMTGRSIGCIASCSKAFVSAAVALLVDEGKLSYDTPIQQIYPDFALMDPIASKECTLRDMLYHRTGIAGHDAMWPDPGLTRDEYMRRCRYLEPNMPFRSVSQYSNTIYNLIGCIVERAAGMPYEDFVRTRILEPLGMDRTSLEVARMRQDPDYATGYFCKTRASEPEEMEPWEMDIGNPAAGINAGAEDMMKWLRLHLADGFSQDGPSCGTRLFSENVMQEMHQPAVHLSAFPWRFPEVPGFGLYGMAWKTMVYRGLAIRYHCGEIEGYCCIQLFVPDKGIGMFVLTNRHAPVTPFLMEIVYTLIDRMFGYPEVDWVSRLHPYAETFDGSCDDWDRNLMTEEPVRRTHPSHAVEDYAGIYENPAYGRFEVLLKDGQLLLAYKKWKLPLEHFHYDTFRVRGLKEDTVYMTVPMTFYYDERSGRINAFTLLLERTVPPVRFTKVS
ncbi:MAG: GNAT family N-acetyltransferase [Firmicutes bacterium]|nr:GNAT family N-acetyltransferase [Bacillota bacterium]